jgi:hypothetical protein
MQNSMHARRPEKMDQSSSLTNAINLLAKALDPYPQRRAYREQHPKPRHDKASMIGRAKKGLAPKPSPRKVSYPEKGRWLAHRDSLVRKYGSRGALMSPGYPLTPEQRDRINSYISLNDKAQAQAVILGALREGIG